MVKSRATKDNIFSRKQRAIKDFNFGEKTAKVFDDMLDRSVPFYAEAQRMISEIAADFATDGSNVYDLGCSTGTTFLALDPVVPKGVRFVGIDSSQAMLKEAREKLRNYKVTRKVELVHGDLNRGVTMSNASLAIMNLTL